MEAAQVKNLGQIAAVIISPEPPDNKKILWYDENATEGCPIKYFDKADNRWNTGVGSSYTHPATHPPSIISQNSNNRFITDTERTAWNAKQNALTLPLSVGQGGTGRTTLESGRLLVGAGTSGIDVTPVASAGQSIRRNSANTAWEAFTPVSSQNNTWTPTRISGMSINEFKDCYYEKIGRVVYINGVIDTDSGAITVGGLPFPVRENEAYIIALTGLSTITSQFFAFLHKDTTNFSCNLGNQSTMRIRGFYLTD